MRILLEKLQALPRFLWAKGENENSQKKSVLRNVRGGRVGQSWTVDGNLCVTVFLLWCHSEGNGVTFDVTNYYYISSRSCAWSRCICLAFQIPHGWKRRDLETCFSLSLCCGCSATARRTAGVLQCRECGPEAEQALPCTGPGDPQGIGVPRVSSSFDFWLFIT